MTDNLQAPNKEMAYHRSRALIHIGAPRTGTTTLQKHLFPKIISQKTFAKIAYKGSTAQEKNTNNMQGGTPAQLIKEIDILKQNLGEKENNIDYLRRIIIPSSIYCSWIQRLE